MKDAQRVQANGAVGLTKLERRFLDVELGDYVMKERSKVRGHAVLTISKPTSAEDAQLVKDKTIRWGVK